MLPSVHQIRLRIIVVVAFPLLAGPVCAGEAGVIGKDIVQALKKFLRERPVKRLEQEELNRLGSSERSKSLKQAVETLELARAEERMWAAADQQTREKVERLKSFLDESNEEDAQKMAKAMDKEKDWKEQCKSEFVGSLKGITCFSIKTYIKTDQPPTEEQLDQEVTETLRQAWRACGKPTSYYGIPAQSLEASPIVRTIKTLKTLRTIDALFNDLSAQHDAIKRLELLIAYRYCH